MEDSDPESFFGRWKWNWTALCGLHGGITPLNPETHDLGLCFQQLCLQIPTLALMAVVSAYYCGKRSYSHERFSHIAINLRLLITACLSVLPIIRAYIILTNTTILPLHRSIQHDSIVTMEPSTSITRMPWAMNTVTDENGILTKLQDGLNDSSSIAKLLFYSYKNRSGANDSEILASSDNDVLLSIKYEDQATSAKPIDYLVAGTEGLAWVVHLCFLLTLRRRNSLNMRGPVAIRALIFMLIGVSALLLRTHVKHDPYDDVVPHLSIGFSIAVVTFLSLYILTLIPGYRSDQSTRYREVTERTSLLSSPSSSYVHFMEVQDPSYLGTAMENSTLLSRLLFHWVTPLMEKGVRGLLKHTDDLYDLPDHITAAAINYGIDKHMRRMPRAKRRANFNGTESPEVDVLPSSNNISLCRLLHQCFGWQFYAVGVLKFIADCTGFVAPLLLNKLVGFIEDKDKPISYGYMYATLMFASTLFGAFCSTHFSFWMSIVGLKIRGAIITLVYRKTLHSSNVHLSRQFTFGEIVNFMSTDSDRIVNSCPSFHSFWSIPLQLGVTLYLLYMQIGVSFLAGVGFAVVLIPINKVLANKIGRLSTKMMDYKDQRVRLMGETLRGLTTIKLNVWEEYFLRSIFKLRESEMKYLKGRKYLDALCVYFWATTPVLISVLTFGTYVLLGNELDAKTVFTSMALLNMLIGPLNAFPWVLNGLTEAWVSVKRIQRLLDLPDLDTSTYYADPPPGMDVMLKNVSFFVSDSHDVQSKATTPAESPVASTSNGKKIVSFEGERVFTLRNLNVEIQKGQLIGVMGKIGGGKSLLLDGILAEITRAEGIVAVHDLDQGFGYVKQNPWLQRGTIRDNILFGKAYDHNKYKNVLTACALTDDLMELPKKDLTGVGEAGNTLSGGQRTRISLARAVYADKPIYLLDDILATLDTKVAKHIFQHVILGLLGTKTRILSTHQTQYLVHADLVLEMFNGKVVRQGLPSEILPDLEDYLLSSGLADSELVVASIAGLPQNRDELANADSDSLLDEEFVERGTVRFGVYASYMGAIGRYLAMSIFLSMLMMQCSRNFTDVWLSFWVTNASGNATNTTNSSDSSISPRLEAFLDADGNGVGYYLEVYAILGLFNSVFTLIRAFMFAYGGIQAAVTMHKQLVKIIMRARTTFFDLHPLGRILNRFSSDTYTIDDSLPFIANILLAQSFALLGSIVVTAYGLPWIFLLLAPLAPVYHWAQQHYRLTSRELKRLSSTALSPLYTHFNETLQGLSSIRAFRVVSRFRHENELFLEASQKAQFSAIAAGQWLSLRLQFIGVVLLAGVCVMAVLQHQFDIADPGLIGLAITYALSVTGLMSGVVNVFTETEREIIAVERVKQYLDNVPSESMDGDNPPYAWPTQGVVEFRDVTLKYREGLTASLRKLSFSTRPAEKIGIVGRTGAGKSSIFNTLFRLVEITSGEILIDNVNVKTLRLSALRSRLAIIPQNPFLFSGTVRENVDPLNQYPDIQIYKTLERCKLHSLVHRLGGLGAGLEENGNNLSAGQKQLFCLVRAILHNARILCIDEATANVDNETDKAIQTTIKSSFRSATVITIAHRIRTIMHCDRVIVMGDGEVLEFEEPNLLIQNTESYFYRLASQEFSDKE